jgi:hypothetical protein
VRPRRHVSGSGFGFGFDYGFDYGVDYGVDHGDDGDGCGCNNCNCNRDYLRTPAATRPWAATQQPAAQAQASSCSNLAIWALDCGRLTHAPAGAGEDTQPSRKWASLQIRGSTREPIHATPADGR